MVKASTDKKILELNSALDGIETMTPEQKAALVEEAKAKGDATLKELETWGKRKLNALMVTIKEQNDVPTADQILLLDSLLAKIAQVKTETATQMEGLTNYSTALTNLVKGGGGSKEQAGQAIALEYQVYTVKKSTLSEQYQKRGCQPTKPVADAY